MNKNYKALSPSNHNQIDKTLHWDKTMRESQSGLLALLPEENREYAAFMFRIGNVAAHYYNQQQAQPTLEDFEDWLTGLPESVAKSFRAKGYERSKAALPLRRHAAERNDIGLDLYMKEALTPSDYHRWKLKLSELE
jgi:hypothetical protein